MLKKTERHWEKQYKVNLQKSKFISTSIFFCSNRIDESDLKKLWASKIFETNWIFLYSYKFFFLIFLNFFFKMYVRNIMHVL